MNNERYNRIGEKSYKTKETAQIQIYILLFPCLYISSFPQWGMNHPHPRFSFVSILLRQTKPNLERLKEINECIMFSYIRKKITKGT